MTTVLRVAGVYNVLWGAFTVLMPHLFFDFAGMPRSNYPELWQCIGMIVGVYGVGYWIAARAPFIHWPIVLVGLMGKVFGPIGLVGALVKGTFTLKGGVVCVFNDLLWWVPFALIPWRAYQYHHARQG